MVGETEPLSGGVKFRWPSAETGSVRLFRFHQLCWSQRRGERQLNIQHRPIGAPRVTTACASELPWEASVGKRVGQPRSRESVAISAADVVHVTEGEIGGRVIASVRRTRRGLSVHPETA